MALVVKTLVDRAFDMLSCEVGGFGVVELPLTSPAQPENPRTAAAKTVPTTRSNGFRFLWRTLELGLRDIVGFPQAPAELPPEVLSTRV